MCEDENEPNEGELDARPLPAAEIEDGDEKGSQVMATLAGTEDADWLCYTGNDVLGGVVDPTVTVSATAELRVCQYIECLEGTADLSACPEGSQSSVSGEGRDRCCTQGDDIRDFTVSFECGVADKSALVTILLDSGAVEACIDYTMDYHF